MSRRRTFPVVLPSIALFGLLLAVSPSASADDPEASAAPASAAQSAATETIPKEKCFRCHDEPEAESDDGRSIAVLVAKFAVGAPKRLDCVECHTDALTIKHPRNNLGPVGFEPCLGCHEEEIGAFHESVHAKVRGDKPILIGLP